MDSQSYFVDVLQDIASFSRVWVWNLLSCLWGALSDERPGLSFPLCTCKFRKMAMRDDAKIWKLETTALYGSNG
jgi:hypothetical protein